MTFWSSQTLKQKLPSLITPYHDSKVQQASYTLGIGNEVFITKDHRNSDNQDTKRTLSLNEAFKIPAGQFAFLLTEETIKVPEDGIAFISMKATFKYKGLVNVSGFHVDPGFNGKLLFSVYNAGPSEIHLQHNEPCFLIWYASLDQIDSDPKKVVGHSSIPISVLNQISTAPIYSLQALTTEFTDLEHNVSKKLLELEVAHKDIDTTRTEADKWVKVLKWGGGTTVTIAFLLVCFISSSIFSLSSSVFNLAKFVIQQKEGLEHIVEYKEVLDKLVQEQKAIKSQPINNKEAEKTNNNKKMEKQSKS